MEAEFARNMEIFDVNYINLKTLANKSNDFVVLVYRQKEIWDIKKKQVQWKYFKWWLKVFVSEN